MIEISPPPQNLKQILSETYANEPIMIVTTPGSDPSEELRTLAHAVVGKENYIEVNKKNKDFSYVFDS